MKLVLACLVALVTATTAAETLPLDGSWSFRLDDRREGVAKSWFTSKLPDKVSLPGTTDTNGKGARSENRNQTNMLSRVVTFHGPAWYQREVVIPPGWASKRITLFLERTKDCQVWVDDRLMGTQQAFAVPQVFDLSGVLAAGSHRITLCVDNTKKPPVHGHQWAEDTQTDWNGVIGRIELVATDTVWLDDVRIEPHVKAQRARVRLTLGNQAGEPASGTCVVSARCRSGGKAYEAGPMAVTFDKARSGATVETVLELGPEAPVWDEFQPALWMLTVQLDSKAGGAACRDSRQATFGLRDFTVKGTQFQVNGKTIQLRGKHDACVFPLTGFPPMEVEGWLRYFRIVKEYGLNHVRFHSWCPPEAAFDAADQVGVYLQPELPHFGGDMKDPADIAFTRAEGKRILAAYGNHPSFVMFALGNEMGGGREIRAGIVRELRAFDGRHLFAQSSNYEFWNPKLAEGDDYWTTFRARKGAEGNVRGSYAHLDAPLGHVQAGPPDTLTDYAKAISGVPVPVIGHEVGQYQVYPNFREIPKYTGVLRPWNFEVFRQRLEAKGMLDQADDFLKASGALAVLCYRAEVETALRTPGFGGFQLLDLQDFPGQGTALVGILDAFNDSKGLIAPEAWREFCSPTVPLARLKSFIWSGDESLTARVQVANYGPSALPGTVVAWSLSTSDRHEVARGELPAKDLPQGALTDLGAIVAPLKRAPAPAKLTLAIALRGTPYRNHYDVWGYPPKNPTGLTGLPEPIAFARSPQKALTALHEGKRVLLAPAAKAPVRGIPGFFASDFWCFPMFRRGNPPGTLGLLCDPAHPALAQFPTESHTNWQWWHILMNSRSVILDDLPAELRPIVQVIDNFDKDRNHRLGLIFEARLDRGKLLFCGSDLVAFADHPEARQLRTSLEVYMASPRFEPKVELTKAQWDKLFPATDGSVN